MRIYDSDIREILIDKISKEQQFVSDPDTVIIHEMDICFGCARIDIAVVNGKIHGYEIKSEQDNLERLHSQIEFYNEVFDTVTIVTTEKHYENAIKIIPEWWGIYCVLNINNQLVIKTKRQPRQNKNINIQNLVKFLWKNELLEILGNNGIVKGVKSKTRLELGEILVRNVKSSHIKKFVNRKLKSRKGWRAVRLQQLYGG